MTRVKCSLSNCEYWAEGNVCTAEVIEVAPNTPTSTDMEIGSFGSSTVITSEQSMCATFKPRYDRD